MAVAVWMWRVVIGSLAWGWTGGMLRICRRWRLGVAPANIIPRLGMARGLRQMLRHEMWLRLRVMREGRIKHRVVLSNVGEGVVSGRRCMVVAMGRERPDVHEVLV